MIVPAATIVRVILSASGPEPEVLWFPWWKVQPALAYGRTGGIALHRFLYDLRRFGLGPRDPACHILSADRAALIGFAARFGLRTRLEPPRPHRPDVWHFDAFGPPLLSLERAYPPPAGIDEEELEDVDDAQGRSAMSRAQSETR
jgi:hypothetical protein